MKITIGGKAFIFKKGVSLETIMKRAFPEDPRIVLACYCNGQLTELNKTVDRDSAIVPITYSDEEGRRIYERSARFVMLMAVENIFPGEHVRIEHSIGHGMYTRILGRIMTKEDLVLIEREMRDIIAADEPFVRERWSKAKAIEYFTSIGETDKAQLLSYRPYDFFDIYKCRNLAEYFYGEMLPSTGYIRTIALRLVYPGMILQMPSVNCFDQPAPYVQMPRHLAAFEQSNQWCRILHCTNAADLNRFIENNTFREFIRVNEALHDKSISDIADGIVEKKSRAVFIAGPSSSGKTTFANRLCVHLRVHGLDPVLISLDDFYRNRSDLQPEADGQIDLESLYALDIPLLKQCLSDLLSGKETMMPHFDFKTSSRYEQMYPLKLSGTQPIVFEGIHGLNPALHAEFDHISKIYVSELTCLNLDNHNRIRTTDARLLRRIVRDYLFRETPAEETMMMWPSVRRGEEKWIFPYQEHADYVFNSVLHYELPVMCKYAYDLLQPIRPDAPTYRMSRRLLKILHYILPAPEETMNEIPPLSILREFIGGCTFYQ